VAAPAPAPQPPLLALPSSAGAGDDFFARAAGEAATSRVPLLFPLPSPSLPPPPLASFDAAAARAFGTVAMALRSAGRKRAARAYDALIAATAIANGLPLYTCNPEDFEGIPALDLHSVPHPDR
jgi:hypothetical protein